MAYFKQYIGGKRNEAFLTMYVDHRNHVLDVVLNQEWNVDHTAVYPREVLKKTPELYATWIFDGNKIIPFSVTISRCQRRIPFGGRAFFNSTDTVNR